MAGFWTGNPAERENISTLRPEQERSYRSTVNAAQRRGAKGVQGQAADIYRDMGQNEAANYYRSNLGNNPADFAAFAAPALRQYHEDIVPGLSEQFAGMGAGGLSSSGFQNAQVQGATDLSERLGALRAQLRENSANNLNNLYQQQAQGLQGINRDALGNYSTNIETRPASEGFLSELSPALGTLGGAAIGGLIGGPPGAMMGAQFGNMTFNRGGNKVGANSIPNWSSMKASPSIGGGNSAYTMEGIPGFGR